MNLRFLPRSKTSNFNFFVLTIVSPYGLVERQVDVSWNDGRE